MSGDLDVRGPGCPGTWMSGDLDVRGPGCPGPGRPKPGCLGPGCLSVPMSIIWAILNQIRDDVFFLQN